MMIPWLGWAVWSYRNMETKAIAKYIRISPQKARLVVDLVRGEKVEDARKILQFTRKYAAGIVSKVLKSAVANAKQNPNIDESILYVKEIFVDQGPTLKRWRARAQGRAASIKKRMSHITVILDEG
jgi:large subunit ribosomal protein L22